MNQTILSSREARTRWRDVLDAVNQGKTDVVIERYGKPVAAVISYQDYEALLEELEDLRDGRYAVAAYEEWLRDPSTARPYEEIRDELIAEGLLDE
jgi:prevent-host-death family protein